MPGTRSLKQTDSFNSSGATIMPEVVSRTDSRTHGSRSGSGSGSGFGGNSLRMLSSQDSVSREFDAALGAGDDGMIRLLQGQSNSGQWDFLRELNLPNDSPHLDIPADGSFHFDPTMLSADPAAHPISDDVPYPQPTTSPTNFQNLKLETSASPFAPSPSLVPDFRPASATSFHSNHSVHSIHSIHSHSQSHSQSVHSYHSRGGIHRDSISGSEYSCSATDVSEDQDVPMTSVTGTGLGQGDALTELNLAGMELGEGGTMQWAAYEAVRRQVDGVSPAVIGLGHAGVNGQGQGQVQGPGPGQGQGGRLGPIRGVGSVGGGGDDDKKRFDRLEHRRSINRKSAQKHRARRKEELETLTQTIAERDSRIAFLEKELAVEKAKFQQMVGFIKDHTVIGARFAQSQAAQATQGQGQAQGQAQGQSGGGGVGDTGSAAQVGAAVGRDGKRRSARLGDPGPW
ncbi:hypothetical protein EHS25_005802 [Saitozyma podzolica]|uniref:BZIP domain-containing protein n=1 Tax=Saitozyma podzolica TaxID=1890683 RepID=A0A427XVF3_9TREE|nr:hypothetical protein EHS25_005802 [Saitozyma podzolica]